MNRAVVGSLLISMCLVAMADTHARDAFADLAPIDDIVGDARIVALGEPTHLDGTAFLVKARLVKYLRERHGFEVLAWESSLWACEVDAAHCLAWPWGNVEETADIRTWAGNTGMHVTGFDPQVTGGGEWLVRHEQHLSIELARDASLVARLHLAFARFPKLGNFRLLDRATRATDRQTFVDARQRARALGASDAELVERMLENVITIYDWHQAVGADQSTTFDWDNHASLNNVRDRAMAENVRWLFEHRYRGKKIILWTANTHAAKDAAAIEHAGFTGYRTTGSWLSSWFGAGYVAIATTAFQGTVGNPPAPKRDIALAPEGSVEARSWGSSREVALVRLDRSPRVARFIGLQSFRASWSRAFDAGIVIRTMHPATPRVTRAVAPSREPHRRPN